MTKDSAQEKKTKKKQILLFVKRKERCMQKTRIVVWTDEKKENSIHQMLQDIH